MAQISYGTITITDTNDIESIIVEYARNQSTSSAPTSGWSTTRPTWAQGYYIWQRTRTHKAGTSADSDIYGTAVCITGSTGQTGGTGAAGRSLTNTITQYTTATNSATITQSNMGNYTWNSNVPSYSSSTPAYWVRVTNTYSNPSSTEYIIYKDNGLTDAVVKSVEANNNAAIANSIAQHANENAQGAMSQATAANALAEGLQTKLKYMWTNEVNSTSYPAGSYMASGNSNTFNYENSSTYGFNSFLEHTKLHFRYNAIELDTIGLDGLKLYAPIVSNNLITSSQLGVELTSTALKFYRPGTATVDAQLNSDGLKITNGSIVLGSTSGTAAGNVTLSNIDFSRSINGTSRSNLRLAIGSNFGVKNDGTLYASNANISGQITVAAGSNVYTTDNVNPLEIGGRNLLLSTGTTNTWTISLNSSNYQAHDCYQTCSPVPSLFAVNDLVTISFDWSTNGTSGNFHIECGKVTPYTWGTVVNAVGTRSATSNYVDITSSNKSGHVSITFKITSSQTSAAETLQWFRIRVDGADMASKTFTVSNAKAERGNKATDWTPAPEDVQAEIDAKKSTFTVNATGTDASQSYAQILAWAAEGQQLTFAVDSTAGIKAGDTVRVKTTVSNMGTEGNRPAVYVVTTCRETPTSSTSIKTTSHGLDTTIIDGGNILTNSIGANQIKANAITANKIAVGDFNNYVTVTEKDANSILTSGDTIENGWLKTNAGYSAQCPRQPRWTTNGESYRITGTVKAPSAGCFMFVMYARNSNGSVVNNTANYKQTLSANTETTINTVITLNNAGYSTAELSDILVCFCTTTTWTGNFQSGYIKNLKCERMSGGELIVDGAITADKIAIGTNHELENILLDSDAPDLTKIKATNNRYWSDAGNSKIVCSNFTLTDAPEEGWVRGRRFVYDGSVATDNYGRSYAFYAGTTNDIPLTPNKTYTASWWARCTSGSGRTRFLVSKGDGATGSVSSPTWTLTRYWKKYTFSFTFGSTLNADANHVWFFARFPTRTAGTVEICGCKLVAGADAESYITRIDDAGIRIHPSNTENNSVVINASGLEIFKGGTGSANSVAKYGDTARVGKEGSGHTNIASTGMKIYGSDGTVELANIGYGSGNNSSGGTSSAPYYTFGEKLLNSSNGNYSVGEGYRFTASGWASHAEGYYTEASGASSHAEGDNSIARGKNSHAEGYSTLATGEDSHAGGTNTIASGDSQTAIGKFNIEDTTSLFIVGNGTSTGSANRSNAFKIDSTGDIYPRNIKMVDFVIEQSTSGNWRWHKWSSGIVEAWYLGQNVTYSGTNTAIALPHTLKKILCLTGNGVLNGSAFTPLTNLWCSTTNVYISFNATGTKLDNLSLYAVYTV